MVAAPQLLILVVVLRLLAGTGVYVLQKDMAGDAPGEDRRPRPGGDPAARRRRDDARESPGALITAGYLGMSIVVLAVAPFVDWRPAMAWRFWAAMSWVPVVEAVAAYMSIYGLRALDMSLFGPINALKAPIALAGAALFKGEYPSRVGMAGVGIIVAGCYLLRPPKVTGQTGVDVWHLLVQTDAHWRILSMILFAASGVFLKTGVLTGGTVVTVCVWVWGGSVTCLCMSRAMPNWGWGISEAVDVWRRRPAQCAALTLLLLTLAVTTTYTLAALLVGYALAFFSFAIVLQVLVGRYRYREQEAGARLWASLVMIAGVVAIAKWG